MSRRPSAYEIRQRLRPAMLALRDAEDWLRLELHDEVLAERVRHIHLALTDDVLYGNAHRDTSWRKAQLWDRYCLWRGKSPDGVAAPHVRFLRRRSGRQVAP